MKVQIVKPGTISIESFEYPIAWIDKAMFGFKGGSTVTLIQQSRNILVDTGFDDEGNFSDNNAKLNEKILLAYLEGVGLEAKDVDAVFLTHQHRDHTGNVDVFAKCGSQIVHACDVNEGISLAEDVTVIDTPGHTSDHKSLLVRLDGLKVVIAGDAIVAPTYYLENKIWRHAAGSDFEKATQSMNKIVEIADYIIPGHGTPFENMRGKGIPLA